MQPDLFAGRRAWCAAEGRYGEDVEESRVEMMICEHEVPDYVVDTVCSKMQRAEYFGVYRVQQWLAGFGATQCGVTLTEIARELLEHCRRKGLIERRDNWWWPT